MKKDIRFRPCTPEDDMIHEDDCPNRPASQAKSGPAQVATDDYRKGWDNVFGIRQPVGEA